MQMYDNAICFYAFVERGQLEMITTVMVLIECRCMTTPFFFYAFVERGRLEMITIVMILIECKCMTTPFAFMLLLSAASSR